jgi:hypothetical protein
MTARKSRTPRIVVVDETTGAADTIEEVVDGEIVDEDTDAMSTDLVVVGTLREETDSAGTTKRKFVFTPYQGHLAVNQMLEAAGVEKKIPPQMMYTYRAQERFASTIGADGRYELDTESFIEWASSYVAKAKKLQDAKTVKAA